MQSPLGQSTPTGAVHGGRVTSPGGISSPIRSRSPAFRDQGDFGYVSSYSDEADTEMLDLGHAARYKKQKKLLVGRKGVDVKGETRINIAGGAGSNVFGEDDEDSKKDYFFRESDGTKMKVLTVEISKEDTMRSLAIKYHTTVEEIKRYNNYYSEEEMHSAPIVYVPVPSTSYVGNTSKISAVSTSAPASTSKGNRSLPGSAVLPRDNYDEYLGGMDEHVNDIKRSLRRENRISHIDDPDDSDDALVEDYGNTTPLLGGEGRGRGDSATEGHHVNVTLLDGKQSGEVCNSKTLWIIFALSLSIILPLLAILGRTSLSHLNFN
eukprot:Nk52_evm22s229 gene=Nk52_evmTU22s229